MGAFCGYKLISDGPLRRVPVRFQSKDRKVDQRIVDSKLLSPLDHFFQLLKSHKPPKLSSSDGVKPTICPTNFKYTSERILLGIL